MAYGDDMSSFFGGREQSTPESSPKIEGKAKIRVIGVGGAGNNAVNRMIEAGIASAEYIAVNTDAQILACNKAEKKIQIGTQLTKGLGAGAEPSIGKKAAGESREELERAIEGTDLLFIATGMGGGTGTGAAPVIAKLAKEKDILTVAVATKPFGFEGRRRMENAEEGISTLRKFVDTLIIIPNEKISEVVPKNATFQESLRVADEVLKQGIRGIADLIVTPSLINLDFADVRTVLKDKGLAHMGVGVAKGENRIVEAVRLAVNCPLLDTTIEGATGVIINVRGGNDITLSEVRTAASLISNVVDYSANIIFGNSIDGNIRDEVEVTVIATGFPSVEEVRAEEAGRHLANAVNRPVTSSMPEPPPRPANYSAPPTPQNRPAPPAQPAEKPYSEAYEAPYTNAPYQQQPANVPAYPYSQAPYQEQAPQKPSVSLEVSPEDRALQPSTRNANQVREDAVSTAGEISHTREADTRDSKLPPFVQRLLGKRK